MLSLKFTIRFCVTPSPSTYSWFLSLIESFAGIRFHITNFLSFPAEIKYRPSGEKNYCGDIIICFEIIQIFIFPIPRKLSYSESVAMFVKALCYLFASSDVPHMDIKILICCSKIFIVFRKRKSMNTCVMTCKFLICSQCFIFCPTARCQISIA